MKTLKKLSALALALALTLSLAACGGDKGGSTSPAPTGSAPVETTPAETTPVTADGTYELALVTDVGNIDDKSFNEGSWNGMKSYAEANGITYAYYRPTEDATEARMKAIDSAIEKGAKVVVCPGYLFEDAIFDAQKTYPDTMFLLLDGEPHTADYSTYETAENTHCILYQEEQAGYLAGYAAVKDGYTKLGFCGGMAVPAVIRYGYGFVQGAEAAAAEMGMAEGDVEIKYWYSGGFLASDDARNKMDGWFTDGTEVVFACGGKVYQSVVAAAEAAGAKVIGVDVDQAAESDLIITSAMKELAHSVELALGEMYANGGTWPATHAGQTATLGAADECVGLPTAEDSWRMETFTVAEYEELFTKMVNGEIEVDNSSDVDVLPATTICAVDNQGVA